MAALTKSSLLWRRLLCYFRHLYERFEKFRYFKPRPTFVPFRFGNVGAMSPYCKQGREAADCTAQTANRQPPPAGHMHRPAVLCADLYQLETLPKKSRTLSNPPAPVSSSRRRRSIVRPHAATRRRASWATTASATSPSLSGRYRSLLICKWCAWCPQEELLRLREQLRNGGAAREPEFRNRRSRNFRAEES
jgi:hypothetical protein